MPRRSRRLNPPCLLDGLSDDLVMRLFSRAPFMTHGTLHVVCRRLKTLLRSPEFLQQRVETGLVEHGLVVAGGWRDGSRTADCSTLTAGGRWRPITPLSGPRSALCSAILEDEDGQPEMWVMGGYDDRWNYLATVEAYNLRTNTWRSCLPLSQRRTVPSPASSVAAWSSRAAMVVVVAALTSVEAYTPTGWTPLPPLPHAAGEATACVLNGRLYVMGGHGAATSCRCWRCQGENGVHLDVKADLPAARRAASIGHEGKIWLIGGTVNHQASGFGPHIRHRSRLVGNGPGTPSCYRSRSCSATMNGELFVNCRLSQELALWIYGTQSGLWIRGRLDDPMVPVPLFS